MISRLVPHVGHTCRPRSGVAGLRRLRRMSVGTTTAAGAVCPRRLMSVPGASKLFTSPGGLMALMYGCAGGTTGSAQSQGSDHPTKRSGRRPSGRKKRGEDGTHTGESASGGTSGGSSSGIFGGMAFSKEAVGLAVLIFALSALWELFNSQRGTVARKLRDCVMVTLEVRSSQEEFAMIVDWMGRQPHGLQARNISITPVTVLDEQRGVRDSEGTDGEDARVNFVPGYGSHFFVFGETWMWVVRHQDESKQRSQRLYGADRENDILTISFFSRRRGVAEDFVCAVRQSWETHVHNKVRIYAGHAYDRPPWSPLAQRARRPLSTLYLPPEVMEVVEEVRTFLELRDTYAALGIPWRRGYLFTGPPGTGKSSFVTALAGELGLSVYLLSMQGEDMCDENLMYLTSKLPPRSILLVEDMENAVANSVLSGRDHLGGQEGGLPAVRTQVSESKEGGVTLSGLLNVLDGLTGSEGRVLIVTSNDPTRIPFPEAVLRPGRIDRRVNFEPMKRAQLHEMASAFEHAVVDPQQGLVLPSTVGDAVSAAATQLLETTEAELTPASIQQQLLAAIYDAMREERAK